jgi:hypothetical protein
MGRFTIQRGIEKLPEGIKPAAGKGSGVCINKQNAILDPCCGFRMAFCLFLMNERNYLQQAKLLLYSIFA